jgi:hypothetical protein
MKVTLKKKNPSQKTITFNKGGLHSSTHTPQGEKIPASKIAAAKSGAYGSKAKKEALFAQNVLTGGH